MNLSGHVQMAPGFKRREWTRVSFVAAFSTYMGETTPHPSDDSLTVVELNIREFDFNGSRYTLKWACIPNGWERAFKEYLFPEFYCQVQSDYSVLISDVNVPATAIWAPLLDAKPT